MVPLLEVDVGPRLGPVLEYDDVVEPERLIDARGADGGTAADQLDLTGAELDEQRVVVRDDAVDDLVEIRQLTPVVGVLLDDDLLFRFPLDELERPGADTARGRTPA